SLCRTGPNLWSLVRAGATLCDYPCALCNSARGGNGRCTSTVAPVRCACHNSQPCCSCTCTHRFVSLARSKMSCISSPSVPGCGSHSIVACQPRPRRWSNMSPTRPASALRAILLRRGRLFADDHLALASLEGHHAFPWVLDSDTLALLVRDPAKDLGHAVLVRGLDVERLTRAERHAERLDQRVILGD